MKKKITITLAMIIMSIFLIPVAFSFSLSGSKFKDLTPKDGTLKIPTKDVSDGTAHYFKVKADDGMSVSFFVLMSTDGVIRAAIDSCDVCYRSGKGYIQEGDFMVCTNCGKRFASSRINDVKGGCNPAPLNRQIVDDNLLISMKDINSNSWYCKYKK